MRHQSETLENHPHLVTANVDQFSICFLQQILAIQQDFPSRWFNQPRQTPNNSGLARAGKPHDHKYFAGMDVKTHIRIGNDVAGIAHGVRKIAWICDIPLPILKKLIGLSTIDFPDVAARHLNVTMVIGRGLHVVLRIKKGRCACPMRTKPQLMKPTRA